MVVVAKRVNIKSASLDCLTYTFQGTALIYIFVYGMLANHQFVAWVPATGSLAVWQTPSIVLPQSPIGAAGSLPWYCTCNRTGPDCNDRWMTSSTERTDCDESYLEQQLSGFYQDPGCIQFSEREIYEGSNEGQIKAWTFTMAEQIRRNCTGSSELGRIGDCGPPAGEPARRGADNAFTVNPEFTTVNVEHALSVVRSDGTIYRAANPYTQVSVSPETAAWLEDDRQASRMSNPLVCDEDDPRNAGRRLCRHAKCSKDDKDGCDSKIHKPLMGQTIETWLRFANVASLETLVDQSSFVPPGSCSYNLSKRITGVQLVAVIHYDNYDSFGFMGEKVKATVRVLEIPEIWGMESNQYYDQWPRSASSIIKTGVVINLLPTGRIGTFDMATLVTNLLSGVVLFGLATKAVDYLCLYTVRFVPRAWCCCPRVWDVAEHYAQQSVTVVQGDSRSHWRRQQPAAEGGGDGGDDGVGQQGRPQGDGKVRRDESERARLRDSVTVELHESHLNEVINPVAETAMAGSAAAAAAVAASR